MEDGKFVTRYALKTSAMEVKGQLPDDMVLLFTSERGWNRSGGPELMPRKFRGQVVSVYLAGGAVELVRARDAATLRWTADDPPAGGKPASFSQYAALGVVIAGFCGAVILHFRRHLRSLGFAALGVGVLSAAAGGCCGFAAQGMYSVKGDVRLGSTAGAAIGFLAGFCFVLVLGYGRDRMRPGVSMVGFATVAGAITGAAASTAVHVFLMIGYEDFHIMYPAAGAGFGIWAGVVLGWIGSGLISSMEAKVIRECAA